MQVLSRPWGAMHYQVSGHGPAVVFANSLGTDLRLWDEVLPLLPGIRAIRFDKRGHGLSDRGGPVSIADFAADAAALIEQVAGGPVVFVGLSIGGMIGQALAASRGICCGRWSCRTPPRGWARPRHGPHGSPQCRPAAPKPLPTR